MGLPFASGLVVSCQALANEPLFGSEIMAKMASAAERGGAVAIRANTPRDIRAIRSTVDLPIIGIYKAQYPDSPVYITPTSTEVDQVLATGAEIISLDATLRQRPHGQRLEDLVALIKRRGRLLMADISTVEEAIRAERLGFDCISTTLSGYTAETQGRRLPDFDLLTECIEHVGIPVFAEGQVSTPDELTACFALGAYAVVIGTAITRPQVITARFVEAYQAWKTSVKIR
jgi:N-acylglucosamine-6-phosphate 2-epimerase